MEEVGVRRISILALLMATLPADAQEIHKCVSAGEISYQSQPCETGSALRTWDARPYEISPQRQAEIDRARRDSERRQARPESRPASRSGRARGRRVSSTSNARHERCVAARRLRDQTLERLGLKRSFADLRRWDDYVYERCKP